MSEGWERLDWDSEFWGFDVATVDAGPEGLRQVAADCDAAGVECAYLLVAADDAPTLIAAQDSGWRYVDTRIELRRETPPASSPPAPVRPAAAGDLQALETLARGAFPTTRFHVDPHFDRQRADELYATWVRNRADDGVLLVAGEAGDPAGFMAGRLNAETGEARHELVAVAPSHRESGIGGALSDALSSELRAGGAAWDGTATQASNLAGLGMFGSRGFEIASFHHWMHRWRT